MTAPRTVPGRHGLQWLRQGLEIFAAAPATWVGVTVLFLLMGVALSVIPLAGMLWTVAIPIHAGGLMLGCEALRRGERLEVRHLFNGFEQPRVQPLAIVGALYLAGSVLFMVPAVVLMIGSTFLSAFAFGTNPSAGGAVASVALVAAVVLVVCAGAMALAMAVWFAPALVVFDGVEALDAMKLSLHAAWQNLSAFVVYGLAVLALGVVTVAPLIAAITLVAVGGERQSGPLAVVSIGGTALFTVLCLFLFMPAAWGAMYASYGDVFTGNRGPGVR